MVSNASDDFPEPLRPVITTRRSRGISTERFFRLCWRAPRTAITLLTEVIPRQRLSRQWSVLSNNRTLAGDCAPTANRCYCRLEPEDLAEWSRTGVGKDGPINIDG